jgi:hypothetical protein
LCRRGRSVLVLTLVCGLVTVSIIPAAPPDVTGRSEKITTSRSVAKPAVPGWLHCSGGSMRVVGAAVGSLGERDRRSGRLGKIKAIALT